MLRSFLSGSAATLRGLTVCGLTVCGLTVCGLTVCGLTVCGSALAAPAPDTAVVSHPDTLKASDGGACATALRAFSNKMHNDGYWAGVSDYGYGYPMGGYGYDGGYASRDTPIGDGGHYADLRPGYEVRSLLAAANVLARNGQQAACESVLDTGRAIYKKYADVIGTSGSWRGAAPDWEQHEINAAQPVTDQTPRFRSVQLIDTEVRNPADMGLGSVHDLVISPKTGKIAYLIIGRGGLFGFDQTFVPVPWTDFKVGPNASLLVLDTTAAAMSAAPAMSDAQFTAHGNFAEQSGKVDAYWQTALAAKAGN